MKPANQMIPLTDFAKAMRLGADDSFPARVDEFESQFGKADDDTLAVLAQAAYYCWGNYHYRDNLIQTCTAISSGRPTSMYLHAQVSPERWAELHSYVVGVQVWLGQNGLDIPDGMKAGAVDMIQGWLGESSNAKRILAALFLNELVPNLLGMNLSKLGSPEYVDPDEYADFTQWYARDDGTMMGDDRTGTRERCVRELSADPQFSSEIKTIVARTVEDKPHSCMHRFGRHLDIQLSSIGALKWRGNPPRCEVASKGSWIGFIERDCGVRSWLAGEDAANDYAATVHASLGVPTGRTRAIVADFLLAQDRGSVFAGGWIGRQSRARGTSARQLFGIDEEAGWPNPAPERA